MPKWINEPPKTDDRFAHRILRTPRDKPLIGIITSPTPVGCNTHFANGRTVPCEGEDDCEACKTGFPYRWHGYAGLLLTSTLEHVVFEYTAVPAKTLAAYVDQHFTLRGAHIQAERPSGRANGRVLLKAAPADLAKWRLPDGPDLCAILCHIWGVQRTEADLGLCRKPQHKHVHVKPGNGDARYPATTAATKPPRP